MGQLSNNQIVGIVLAILGVILLLDRGSVAFLSTALGIVLLVVGILILMHKLRGEAWIAVTCIVLGALLVLPGFGPVKDVVQDILAISLVIVGVILIVLGVLKIAEKA